MTDEPNYAGWIAAGVTALSSFGGGALLFKRVLRKEGVDAKQDGREAAHFSRLEAEIAAQRQELKKLTERADTFAGERNAAEARAAKAEAKLEAVAEKIATLTEERKAARELLAAVEAKYDALVVENATLAATLEAIKAQNILLKTENDITREKLATLEAIIERRQLAHAEENRTRRGEDNAKTGVVG